MVGLCVGVSHIVQHVYLMTYVQKTYNIYIMDEQKIVALLEQQDKKIDAMYKSVESARKLFLATLILTIVTMVLPLVGMLFAVPWMLSVLGDAYGGLL